MATMKYNKNPISLREGKIVIDGLTVVDQVKCEIIFTPAGGSALPAPVGWGPPSLAISPGGGAPRGCKTLLSTT